MKCLSIQEIEVVNGSGIIESMSNGAGILGTAAAIVGGAIYQSAAIGSRWGYAGAIIGGSFGAGWGVGSLAYDVYDSYRYN